MIKTDGGTEKESEKEDGVERKKDGVIRRSDRERKKEI